MMLLTLIILVLFFIWYRRSPEKMTDEMTVNGVMERMNAERPELVPIETVYIDPNGNSRFLVYNTDNYAGEVYDFNAKVGGVTRNVQSYNGTEILSEYSKA
jgi:hypothetical protein